MVNTTETRHGRVALGLIALLFSLRTPAAGEQTGLWALRPPARAPLPALADPEPARGTIDRHVRARLEREGLQPARRASRRTLFRRLSFDLLGVGPVPAEVAAFEQDERPDAIERAVDRMLASPLFGERLAVYWLDLVRFADTTGIHADNTWDIFPYRDWVIDAFNSGMGFDRFTREQLGGDLIPQATVRQRIAASYNRLNLITREGGSQAKEFLAKYTADRVRNASAVWLAMTLGCSECHDHKFDPLTARDFYRFGAFFADIEQVGVYSQGAGKNRFFPPYMPVPTRQERAEIEHIESRTLALDAALEGASSAEAEASLRGELEVLRKRRAAIEASVDVILATRSREPMTTRVLPRGNWMDETGEIVTPGVPRVLGELDTRPPNRLGLADWLVQPENPLVARVFVNRIWKLLFGRGLVASLDDFGSQGAPPTHPAILDHLALDFVASGWDIKGVFRSIVGSETYRQDSTTDPETRRRDPDNALLARQGRFRLDAEFIRDNALEIAGLLSHRIGGRSVRPYQPAGYYAHLNFPRRTYRKDSGENLYRRSVYTHWQRQFVHPSLLAFDAPTRERCTAERMRSNTPLGALVLLNDPIYVEAARALAERVLEHAGDAVSEGVRLAFWRALNREPVPRELAVLTDLFSRQHAHFLDRPGAARELLSVGDRPTPVESPAGLALHAAWTSVARVVLNLHETITRY